MTLSSLSRKDRCKWTNDDCVQKVNSMPFSFPAGMAV